MHQPKKRYARTEAQQRHDQRGRSYWHRPRTASWYTGWAQSTHRAQTRHALAQLRGGREDAVFPFHHHHWLKWWWS